MRKKEQRFFSKKNMIGIFIVLIMVMSGIGFVVMQNPGSDSTAEYNGYSFTSPAFGEWYTKIGERSIKFTYHPKEIENIIIEGDALNYILNTKMVYIAFSPEDRNIQEIELARLGLENELPMGFGIFPISGVTEPGDRYNAFTRVDCSNATLFVPVILFRTSEEAAGPMIRTEGSCIILEAQSSKDIQALKDRLLYGLYRIID